MRAAGKFNISFKGSSTLNSLKVTTSENFGAASDDCMRTSKRTEESQFGQIHFDLSMIRKCNSHDP